MRKLLVILVLLSAARQASAQRRDPWLVINEPIAWSEDRALSAAVGARIQVVGQAFDPSGVASVSVHGMLATLKANPAGFVDFDATLTVVPGMTDVTVVAKGKAGSVITKTLHVAQETPQQSVVVQRRFSPRTAMFSSLLLPGAGQFYTKQPLLGGVFLAGAGAALAAGATHTEEKVQCAVVLPEGVSCPFGYELRRYKTHPWLGAGIAGYVAIGVISAVEARTVAHHKNEARRGDTGDGYLPQLGMFVDQSSVGLGLSWRF